MRTVLSCVMCNNIQTFEIIKFLRFFLRSHYHIIPPQTTKTCIQILFSIIHVNRGLLYWKMWANCIEKFNTPSFRKHRCFHYYASVFLQFSLDTKIDNYLQKKREKLAFNKTVHNALCLLFPFLLWDPKQLMKNPPS